MAKPNWNPKGAVNLLSMFSNPKAPGINAPMPDVMSDVTPPTHIGTTPGYSGPQQWRPYAGGFNKNLSRGYGQPMIENTFYPEWGKENAEQRWLESQSDDQLKFWQRYIEYQMKLGGHPTTTIGAGGNVNRATPRYSNEVLERMLNAINGRLGEGGEGLQQMPAWGGYGSIVNQRY